MGFRGRLGAAHHTHAIEGYLGNTSESFYLFFGVPAPTIRRDCETSARATKPVQVGAHYIKDLFDMFVMEPAKDAVVDGAVDATGTQSYVNSYTSMQHQAQRYAMNGQHMFNQFNQKK